MDCDEENLIDLHIHFIEFEMYIENCIMKGSNGIEIMLQKPSKEGLINFIRQIRKVN